jgi:hypothetical protein
MTRRKTEALATASADRIRRQRGRSGVGRRAAGPEERIGAVIGDLYDAAAEPERWPTALTGISELLGAVGAQFLLMDNEAGTVPLSVHAGFDPEVNRIYCGYYGAIDSKQPYFLNSPPGKPFLCHEHFSEDFVRRSEFFQDFLIPSGSRWCMGTKLVQTPDVSAMIGIHRSVRMAAFADDSVALFEGLVPHLQRAAGCTCASSGCAPWRPRPGRRWTAWRSASFWWTRGCERGCRTPPPKRS